MRHSCPGVIGVGRSRGPALPGLKAGQIHHCCRGQEQWMPESIVQWSPMWTERMTASDSHPGILTPGKGRSLKYVPSYLRSQAAGGQHGQKRRNCWEGGVLSIPMGLGIATLALMIANGLMMKGEISNRGTLPATSPPCRSNSSAVKLFGCQPVAASGLPARFRARHQHIATKRDQARFGVQ